MDLEDLYLEIQRRLQKPLQIAKDYLSHVRNVLQGEIDSIHEERYGLALWLAIYLFVGFFKNYIISKYKDLCWEVKSFYLQLFPGGGNYEDLIHQLLCYDRFGVTGFQTPKSQNMVNLIATHNQIFGYCIFVVLFVFFFLVVTLIYYTVSPEKKLGAYPYENVERKLERLSKLYEGIKTPKEELFFYDSYFSVVVSDGSSVVRVPLKKDFPTFLSFNTLNKREEELYKQASKFGKVLKALRVKSQVIREKKVKKMLTKVSYVVPKDSLTRIKVDQTSRTRRNFWDNIVVETVWTLVPSFILIAIALPSFFFLYSLSPDLFYDETTVFLKVIGHQWYWSYEFPSESFVILQRPVEQSFSSYMLPTSELKENMPRLLTVDNPLYLPTNTNIVIRVTSEDVIHSWAIPSLGVKLDCIPGRINEFVFQIDNEGPLYGQCSELCGVNHGFMPIHVVAYKNV